MHYPQTIVWNLFPFCFHSRNHVFFIFIFWGCSAKSKDPPQKSKIYSLDQENQRSIHNCHLHYILTNFHSFHYGFHSFSSIRGAHLKFERASTKNTLEFRRFVSSTANYFPHVASSTRDFATLIANYIRHVVPPLSSLYTNFCQCIRELVLPKTYTTLAYVRHVRNELFSKLPKTANFFPPHFVPINIDGLDGSQYVEIYLRYLELFLERRFLGWF